MITKSGFSTSFNEIEEVLKYFGLFREKGIKCLVKDGVSSYFRNASIKDDYFGCYRAGLVNFDYDFLLNDESYFQFEFDNLNKGLEVRYAFFQNPIEYKSYEDFILEVIIPSGLAETIDEVGLLFDVEYRQFLNEREIKNKYLTIRYDVDYPNYKPIIHSVSHLHIGHQNNLRIPINKFITPLRFVVFVIKNVYYREWKTVAEKNSNYIEELLKKCSDGECILDSHSWDSIEKLDIHLK